MTTPTNIGRYQIIEEIGHGAMGVVYLAHDPRIDRRVAIKTIHALDVLPAGEAEEIRLRFTREAQAAGRLQHPGIVTIFDVGEQDGVWFIAMEYIEGDTLEPYTSRQRLLPPPTVLELIAQACDALDYAHQQHIVHRDIKPANLMLLKNGKLKITDFGLAKNPHTSLTQEGILIGTPNYMSPEQVMGRPLDGRSDLFSLAAVLYELLTGDRPFPGDTVTTIIYRILNEQPEPPQVANKGIPPAVGQVLMRALAKDPDRRYPTGSQLAMALRGQEVELLAEGVGSAQPLRVTQRSVAARPAPRPEYASASPALAPSPMSARPGAQVEPVSGAMPQNAPRAAARPASRATARPERQQVTVPAAGWGAGLRTGTILLAALALVLLVPVGGTIDDRWGQGSAGGKQPFYRTAGILAGGGGTSGAPLAPGGMAGPPSGTPAGVTTPPAVALPGGAGSIAITWRTTPPGGRIYFDDVEAPGGVVHLPRGDRASHSVVAESDCFIEKVTWKAGQDKDGATHTIALKTPKVAGVPMSSKPSGARILLDGRDTGQITPSDLSVPICGSHTVALKLEGYKDVETKLGKPGGPLSLTLARIPIGYVKFTAPYPVTVFEGSRQIGQAGAPIKLTGGTHKLTLRNEDLFVERVINVTVQADKTITPEPRLPATGTLTVLTSPGNCTIFVNGRDLGPPPINDYRLAAGTYTIRATYVPTGQTQETSVTVTAGAGARVPLKFTP